MTDIICYFLWIPIGVMSTSPRDRQISLLRSQAAQVFRREAYYDATPLPEAIYCRNCPPSELLIPSIYSEDIHILARKTAGGRIQISLSLSVPGVERLRYGEFIKVRSLLDHKHCTETSTKSGRASHEAHWMRWSTYDCKKVNKKWFWDVSIRPPDIEDPLCEDRKSVV